MKTADLIPLSSRFRKDAVRLSEIFQFLEDVVSVKINAAMAGDEVSVGQTCFVDG